MELFGLSDLSIINSERFRYSIYADEGQAGLVLRIVDHTGLDGWVVEIPREFLTDAIRSAFQERTNVIMQIAADRLLSLEIANHKAEAIRQATQETERLLKKINEGGLGELLIEYARMELANMGVAGYTLIGAAMVGVTLFGWAAAGRPGLRPLRSWLRGGTPPKRPVA